METNKDEIRLALKAWRDKRSPTEVKQKSTKICQNLLRVINWDSIQIVGCYLAIANEVDCSMFIDRCLQKNIVVCVPALISNNRYVMTKFISWQDVKTKTGTFQPTVIEIVPSETIDLIICPGIAFTLQGDRIGYGMGIYDRLLTSTRADCVKIGVCYREQIIDKITAENWDILMNRVITD